MGKYKHIGADDVFYIISEETPHGYDWHVMQYGKGVIESSLEPLATKAGAKAQGSRVLQKYAAARDRAAVKSINSATLASKNNNVEITEV